MATATITLLQEEELSELIRSYPVIYDKREPSHKEKDVITNAWKAIAASCDFVNDEKTAESLFKNLKKRYQKKKAAVKRADKSGTGSAEFEKAKKDFEPYAFLSWIDTYCATRSAKSNIIMKEDMGLASSGGEEIDDEESPVPKKKMKMKNNKMKQKEIDEEKDEEELKIIRDLHSTIKQSAEDKKEESPDEVYGRYIASEVGRFNELEKTMLKHEIEGVLFKYKMLKYKPQQAVAAQDIHTEDPYTVQRPSSLSQLPHLKAVG